MPRERRTVQRFCRFCGREFTASVPHATHCSAACAQKTWRARAMLAGTHGQVNGQFKRL